MTHIAPLLLLMACVDGTDKPGAPSTEVIDADGDGVPVGEDCADGDADIRPGADEQCNGLDDDCDGEIDEDASDARVWFPDRDADGFGDDSSPVRACQAPSGFIAQGGDCDDATATAHPGREELCNGRDDDCDGDTDEAGASGETVWFADADGDGFGDPESPTTACAAPAAHVLDGTDCDDGRADTFPGAAEICGTGEQEACELTPAQVLSFCGPGGEATVATVSLAVFDGATAGDRAGDRVAAGADMDGDGIRDLLIGSSLANASGTGAGAVWVVSGATTGVMELGAASIAVVTGTSTGDGVGAAVLAPGDLDGDGEEDLLIGSIGDGSGQVAALRGPVVGANDINEAAWATWTAPAGSGAGAAIAAGTFGAGGALALAIGAPGTDAGGVHLVTDISAGGDELDSLPLLTGARSGGRAGATLVPAGDVNGDGITDLLVGALTDDRGAPNGGAAFLLHGPLTTSGSLDDADAIVRGTRTGAALGGGLGAPGDVDGDGTDDILVGAYADSSVAIGAGVAYLFAGPLTGTVSVGTAQATLLGQYRGDALGQEIGGPGDINGDGIPDLLMGSPAADRAGTASGAAFVFLGPVSGTRSAELAEAIVTGIAAGGRVGAAVAFVPDLTGDGTDELFLGSPAASPGSRTSAGAAYLVPGGGP